jgi:hypothetical protein
MPAEVWAAVKARNEVIAETVNVNPVEGQIELQEGGALFVAAGSRDGSPIGSVEICCMGHRPANEFGD